jgi:hypothetical protein
MVGHRSRWKTKNVLKKPFKKGAKLDDIQANIKEGENTNQKTQHSKVCAFCSKITVAFPYLFVHNVKNYSYGLFVLCFSNYNYRQDAFLVKLCFHIVCNLEM